MDSRSDVLESKPRPEMTRLPKDVTPPYTRRGTSEITNKQKEEKRTDVGDVHRSREEEDEVRAGVQECLFDLVPPGRSERTPDRQQERRKTILTRP